MFRKICDNLVDSTIGVFKHSAAWVMSGKGDLIYHNPNFKAPDPSSSLSPKGITIYCVHGTADRVSSFSFIAEELIHKLPNNVASIKLISFDHRGEGVGIEDFSEQVRNKIQFYGDEDVILVGHSRGGIVNAHLAEQLQEDDHINVHAVINICSPFMGSDLAIPPLSWISTSVKQMQRGSEFLNQLADKIRHSAQKYYYFSAVNDAIVDTSSACIPEHKDKLVILPKHGHLSIMSSSVLATLLQKRIAQVAAQFGLSNDDLHHADDQYDLSLDSLEIIDKGIPLENACIDLDLAIENLMSRIHIYPATDKINVLLKLLGMLRQMLNGDRGEYYPSVDTIDGFINAYLHDQTMGNGRKPIDILNDPLNYPLSLIYSLFKEPTPESKIFVDKLLSTYKDIPLPMSSHSPELNTKIKNEDRSNLMLN